MTLSACARVSLPGSLQLPEQLAEDEKRSTLATALRQLANAGMKCQRPYFGLGGTSSFVKRRFLVPDSRAQTREQLLWEARQALEEDYDDFVLDVLQTSRYGFVVAARREVLELYGQQYIEAQDAQGRVVLVRDGEFEAEAVWEWEDDSTLMTADRIELLRSYAEGLLDTGQGTQTADRVWLASAAAHDAAEHLAGLGRSISPLDPFARMSRRTRADEALEQMPGGGPALAIAAGLAFRGLADA